MSSGDQALTVEAIGETVGEAKWSAMRELERRFPGLDRAAVEFQILSEGERGLMGVGREPARVLEAIDRDVGEQGVADLEVGIVAHDRAVVLGRDTHAPRSELERATRGASQML